jgi:mono/diheme cytochrome c family protein
MMKPLLCLFTLLLMGPTQTPAPAPTPIPPEAAKMVSPVKPTAESLAHARKVYGYECALCHGATGNGKGDVAAQMNLTLRDWTNPASLKDMTDGELYYVILKGRGNMTGEEGRASPEVLWNMVALVRAYGK